MLKNSHDARAIRTEERLKKTMLALLREKPLRQITAVELCRLSQVNRATFYDHFQDVYDLVDKLEEELLFQLRRMMEELEQAQTDPEEVSRRFFGFIRENSGRLNLFLNKEAGSDFAQKLDQVILPYFEKAVRKMYEVPPEKEEKLRVALRFLASGYYSLYWRDLKSGRNAEEVSALAAQMSEVCLKSLFASDPGTASVPQ